MENVFPKSAGGISEEDAEREWFASLLWRAFPESKTPEQLSKTAAKVLTRKGRPVTSRTVKNWLGCHNTPHFRYVLRVYALAKFEGALKAFEPEDPAS